MDISYSIDLAGLNAKLAELQSKLNSVDMLRAGQTSLRTVVADHIDMLAATRHDTASRLGASPTGHYDSNKVYAGNIDGNTADVVVAIPGINRAYQDVDIFPVNAKALTIPLHSTAYGMRVSELKSRGIKVFRPKGTNVLGMKDEGGNFTALYALCSSVHQPQDRTLMPDDETMLEATREGMVAYVDMILRGLNTK